MLSGLGGSQAVIPASQRLNFPRPASAMTRTAASSDSLTLQQLQPKVALSDPMDPPPSPQTDSVWHTIRLIGAFVLPTAIGAGLGLGIAAATGASLGIGALIGGVIGLGAIATALFIGLKKLT
ncbi:MAG: hypothetical protein H7338_16550 [Candidatus Sericytochromatia bacterium]|nr:hypothetical protein [Candidatus Sericytochromatia bacterium]